MKNEETVCLTKDEAFAVANHIDMTLIETIRNDTDIDSMKWLRGMIHAYEKLCQYSGYVGLTDSDQNELQELYRSVEGDK